MFQAFSLKSNSNTDSQTNQSSPNRTPNNTIPRMFIEKPTNAFLGQKAVPVILTLKRRPESVNVFPILRISPSGFPVNNPSNVWSVLALNKDI